VLPLLITGAKIEQFFYLPSAMDSFFFFFLKW
jgi:hypothetical protein